MWILRDSGLKQTMVVTHVATREEFAGTRLCANRPIPQYYDLRRISKEFKGMKVLMMRPDTFVDASCRSRGELPGVLDGLTSALLV